MKDQLRSAHVRAVRQEERRISAVASTEALDSYGTIVRANWDFTRFLANPVLLFVHKEGELPVGHCENVRLEGSTLVFDAVFDDVTDLDRAVWEKYRIGTMRGFSVRFKPLEHRQIQQDGLDVTEFLRSELLEISCAPLPSNPEALRRSAGRSGERTMRRSELMKALRAIAEGDGAEDEKKAARETYDAMGGDDGCKKAESEESEAEKKAAEGDGAGGGEGGGSGDDPPPTSRSAGVGARAGRATSTPYEEPARTARRSASPANGLEGTVARLVTRLDDIEKRSVQKEIDEIFRGRPDLAPSVVQELRAIGDSAQIRRIVGAIPKGDMRAPATVPATRGKTEGESPADKKDEQPDYVRSIQRVLGMVPRDGGTPGISAPDETGTRRLIPMTPSEARAAKAAADRKAG